MAIFLLLLFVLASTLPSIPAQSNLIFSVQWGASVCAAVNVQCTGTKTPTAFTIHGLWERASQRCTPFDPNALTPLTDQLKKAWPDVYSYGKDNPTGFYIRFWQQEWNRHGCYTGLTTKDYFELVLKAYTAMGDLVQDIRSAPCSPGEVACNLQSVLNVYDAKYPTRLPRIICIASKSGSSLIQEFRFKVSAAGVFQPLGGSRTTGCSGTTALLPRPITSALPELVSEALLISQVV